MSNLTSQIISDQPCLMRPDFAIIQITGDALQFLQGQLTLDVNLSTESSTQFGGYCNLQGRLHALYFLIKPSFIEGYWMVLPRTILEHTLKTLKGYARFSKVVITEASADYDVLAYHGKAPLDSTLTPTWGSTHQQNNTIKVSLGTELWLVCGQASSLAQLWDDAQLVDSSSDNWALQSIQMGLPSIQAQTIESFLPHYLNLDKWSGISFSKGCYLGQEIIARMQYKATIKKHLYRLNLANAPLFEPGTPLLHPQTQQCVGEVVLSVLRDNHCLALVSMQDNYNEPTIAINQQNYSQKTWVVGATPCVEQ